MGLTTDAYGNLVRDLNPTPYLESGVASGPINAFTPVYWNNSTKKWVAALNDTAAHSDAVGVALNAAVDGGAVKVAPFGSQLPKALFVDANNASLFANVTTEKAYVGTTAGTYADIPAAQSNKYARQICQIYGNTVMVVADKPVQIT